MTSKYANVRRGPQWHGDRKAGTISQFNPEKAIREQQSASSQTAARKKLLAQQWKAYNEGNPFVKDQSAPSATNEQLDAIAELNSQSIMSRAFGAVEGAKQAVDYVNPLKLGQYSIVAENVPGARALNEGYDKVEDSALRGAKGVTKGGVVLADEGLDAVPDWARRALKATGFIDLDAVHDDTHSDRGIWERIDDPKYGFGEIIEDTGNTWVDRAIGFAGDMALDPTTYLTLGSTKFTGVAGRQMAANNLEQANRRALAAGLPAPFAEEGMAKVAKYGVSHGDDAMRKHWGVDTGVKLGGATLPGTQTIGRNVSKGMSAIRVAAAESPLGRYASTARLPSVTKRSAQLVAGNVKPEKGESVSTALKFLGSQNANRRASAMVTFETRDKAMTQGLRKMKRPGRIEASRQLELGDLSDPIVAAAADLFRKLGETATSLGATGQATRLNYLPHYRTAEGQRVMNRYAVEPVGKPKKQINTAQSAGAAHSREFVAGGTYKVEGMDGRFRTVKLQSGTADEVNRLIGGAISGDPSKPVRLFEEDLGAIINRAVNNAARDAGTLAQLKVLRESHPELVRSYADVMGDAKTVGFSDAAKAVDEGWTGKVDEAFVTAARDGDLGPRMEMMVEQGMEVIESQLFAEGGEMIASKQVADAFKLVVDATKDPEFGKILAKYRDWTAMFKTYATLHPGFHVRNGMSAMFMNFSDGVTLGDHREAFEIMQKLRKEGPSALDDLTPEQRLAFEAAAGTGMSGGLSASETALGGQDGIVASLDRIGASKVARGVEKISDNRLTRWNRELGAMGVEGPVRLAATLNTAKAGAAAGRHADDVMNEAMHRATRLHFDYSQASALDEKAKMFIPFWTFMSRNIPLQLQQQFLKPKSYARYQHLKDALDMSGPGDLMPSWMEAGGAVQMFEGESGAYFDADMPFEDMGGQIANFTDFGTARGNMNPLLKTAWQVAEGNTWDYDGDDRDYYDGESTWFALGSNLLPPLQKLNSYSGGLIKDAARTDGKALEPDDQKIMNALLRGFGIPIQHRDKVDVENAAIREQRRDG